MGVPRKNGHVDHEAVSTLAQIRADLTGGGIGGSGPSNINGAVQLWKTLSQDAGQNSPAWEAIVQNGGKGGFFYNWLKNLGLLPVNFEI